MRRNRQLRPIRNRRREVGPILPLERMQRWRVVEADQLKIWHGELEARCRFRPGSSILIRFDVGGFPAQGLPIDKGTFTDFWRVSFLQMFLPFESKRTRWRAGSSGKACPSVQD